MGVGKGLALSAIVVARVTESRATRVHAFWLTKTDESMMTPRFSICS